MNKKQLAKIYYEVQELRKEQRILNNRYNQCEKDILALAMNHQLGDIPALVEEMKANKHRRQLIIAGIEFRWRKVRESGHDASEASRAYFSIGIKKVIEVA